MDLTRRSFLGSLTLILPALWVTSAGVAHSPSAGQESSRPKFPPEIEPVPPPASDPHAVLKGNQKEIKRDARRLAELAEELRKEVEKTDSAEVLSLPLVRKADEIEKLARRIKALARG